MRTRDFASSALAFILWTAAGTTAWAQESGDAQASMPSDSSPARALFMEGKQAYDTGRYEVAIERWRAAYELEPRAPLLYNLAQAHGRLGQVEEEGRYLRQFLEGVEGDHPLANQAQARLDAIEERLARTMVTLEGGIDGSKVFVDGNEAGALPLGEPLRLEPGPHEIEVRLEGYQPFTASVEVRAGAQSVVKVQQQKQVVVKQRAKLRTPGLALAIGGGALAAAGAVTGGLALSASDGAVDGSSDADRARTLALITDIAVPLGAAAATTGLILLIVDKRRGKTDVAFTPWVGPQLAGGALRRAF